MTASWTNRSFQKLAIVFLVALWTSLLLRNPARYRNFLGTSPATDTSTAVSSVLSGGQHDDPLYSGLIDDTDDDVAEAAQLARPSMPKTTGDGKTNYRPTKSSQKNNPDIPAHEADQQAHAAWEGYSVKPIAYIFPAFYPFKENNEIWGDGWTEWINVKGVEYNGFGLETIRPADSIGYYNGLEYATRKRQAKYLKDSGFYGAVFHHYWFAGVPVMDHVLHAMLEDGEPNIPFMLSWANEPWRARWGGLNHDTLFIDQDYGHIADWRKHFDWCLPFFKHPNHIRSAGRIQFLVYKPEELGHVGPHMFAAWREWALEEGFELEIIETRTSDATRWNQGEPDAINEFQPHVIGHDQTKHPWAQRTCRVYHRATFVCWDATPRYFDDMGRSSPQAFCHPKTWEWAVVRMLGRIKNDPNPIGTENFMFVNALNEWGEGNSLEPSVQFGDGYSKAMRKAIDASDKIHVWLNHYIKSGYQQVLEKSETAQTPDVCVIVRAHPLQEEDGVFPISDLMTSLMAQKNPNWVAVAYQRDRDGFGTLEQRIEQRMDSRLRFSRVPEEYLTKHGSKDDGSQATDWMLKNLTTTDPQCGSARYVLITEGSNTYASNTFDLVSGKSNTDIIGMNVGSKRSLFDHPEIQKREKWNEYCDRLEDSSINLCYSADPTNTPNSTDLSSLLIHLPKLLSHTTTTANFTSFTLSHPQYQAGALISSLLTNHAWTYAPPPSSKDCHCISNPSYSACKRTGGVWFDGPLEHESGCYRPTDLPGLGYEWLDLGYTRREGVCARFNDWAFAERIEARERGNDGFSREDLERIEREWEDEEELENTGEEGAEADGGELEGEAGDEDSLQVEESSYRD